ncbi:MAG: metal ABC transporter ATP-binding protein [Rhodopila sp.]
MVIPTERISRPAIAAATIASAGTFLASSRRALSTLLGAIQEPGSDDSPPADALPPGEDNGIVLRNLSVRLGRRLALQDITGRFEPGSLTAIVGPNGAGKSTLLNVLAGLLRPHRGQVLCHARTRHRVAYLEQQAALDRDFPVTVTELAGLGLWQRFGAFRTTPPALADRIDEALDTVGLSGLAQRRIGELSVGQMRRALFARLLLLDAEVMLLDEPFAAVDAATQQALLALLARWHAERRTVIAVVHDFDQVRAHFPATLVLARRAIGWGDTASVLTDANLARAVAVA